MKLHWINLKSLNIIFPCSFTVSNKMSMAIWCHIVFFWSPLNFYASKSVCDDTFTVSFFHSIHSESAALDKVWKWEQLQKQHHVGWLGFFIHLSHPEKTDWPIQQIGVGRRACFISFMSVFPSVDTFFPLTFSSGVLLPNFFPFNVGVKIHTGKCVEWGIKQMKDFCYGQLNFVPACG